jgi:hypothetical protein
VLLTALTAAGLSAAIAYGAEAEQFNNARLDAVVRGKMVRQTQQLQLETEFVMDAMIAI